MSYGRAAEMFQVPKATIHKKSLKSIVTKEKPGKATVLTADEETTLVELLTALAARGFPRSEDFVLDEVQKILKADGRENRFVDCRPGRGWFTVFLQRHPELTFRKPEALTAARNVIFYIK